MDRGRAPNGIGHLMTLIGLWSDVRIGLHQTSNTGIRHNKSQNLNVSRLVLQLSLPNPLKPGVKSRMKMQLEQRSVAVLVVIILSVAFLVVPFWSVVVLTRSRTTLKFWSATMLGAAARNFGPVHKFELPTVIADSVPRATRVFSLASVGHVTGHMVCHMVPIARCRLPYWKIFTVNNLATVF